MKKFYLVAVLGKDSEGRASVDVATFVAASKDAAIGIAVCRYFENRSGYSGEYSVVATQASEMTSSDLAKAYLATVDLGGEPDDILGEPGLGTIHYVQVDDRAVMIAAAEQSGIAERADSFRGIGKSPGFVGQAISQIFDLGMGALGPAPPASEAQPSEAQPSE